MLANVRDFCLAKGVEISQERGITEIPPAKQDKRIILWRS